jgi:hypothetical protein
LIEGEVMTFKDFAAYVGAAIFVIVFAGVFLWIPIYIFSFIYVLSFVAAICIGYFSVWGFVTVCDKPRSSYANSPQVAADSIRKKRCGRFGSNPGPTYPKPPAPPKPPPTTETIRKHI